MSKKIKISEKWRKHAELYKIFSLENINYDWSEEAALEMYIFETYGRGGLDSQNVLFLNNSRPNGFLDGKKWLNVQVAAWREDISRGLLHPNDLYEDPIFYKYHWWLDDVLKGVKFMSNPVEKKAENT